MVTESLMVPCQAEHVIYAECAGSQKVALQADAVSIPGGHLQHRLEAQLLYANTGSKAGHTHYRCLVVGDVYDIHIRADQPGFFVYYGSFSAAGGTAFRGDPEMSGCENLFQFTRLLWYS